MQERLGVLVVPWGYIHIKIYICTYRILRQLSLAWLSLSKHNHSQASKAGIPMTILINQTL